MNFFEIELIKNNLVRKLFSDRPPKGLVEHEIATRCKIKAKKRFQIQLTKSETKRESSVSSESKKKTQQETR